MAARAMIQCRQGRCEGLDMNHRTEISRLKTIYRRVLVGYDPHYCLLSSIKKSKASKTTFGQHDAVISG